MAEAYIVAAVRTAGGWRNGRLRDWHPVDLGAAVIDEVVRRSGTDPALVEDVIFGFVSHAGEQSTNVARNAVLASCLPETVPGTAVDRLRLRPAGAAFRRASGDVRHHGHCHCRWRREHDPRADGNDGRGRRHGQLHYCRTALGVVSNDISGEIFLPGI